MLTIRDMGFSIAGKPLFEGASAQLPAGARIGPEAEFEGASAVRRRSGRGF